MEATGCEKMIELLEQMRDILVQVSQTKRKLFDVEGCFGNVMALLTAGYTCLSSEDRVNDLLAHQCTGNWAFLVNEHALRASIERNSMGGAYVDPNLEETHQLYEVTPSCEKDFCQVLQRVRIGTGDNEKLIFKLNGNSMKFVCSTYFPRPVDDFLLYFILAGNPRNPGLRLITESKVYTQKSVSSLIAEVFARLRKDVASPDALVVNWLRVEWRVAVSFILALNSGPLSGISLESLLKRVLEELIESDNFVELQQCNEIVWDGEFTGKFVFPVGCQMPLYVHTELGTREYLRPGNKFSCDAAVVERFKLPTGEEKIRAVNIVEVKSIANDSMESEVIQDALKCKDSNAKVSFVVVEKSVGSKYPFKIAKGPPLDDVIFCYVYLEGKRVKLKPIDGQPLPTAKSHYKPKRLVFLISIEDINRQATLP